MTDFKHVRAGEPLVISAGAYNAMLDAAQAHRNRRINLAPQGSGFDSLFVHVVNETGKVLPRFSVVGLDAPLQTQDEDEFCNRIVFKGAVPKKKHRGKFAVIQQDAAPEQVVRACVYGTTVAKIQSSSSSEIKYCDIKENETEYLSSGGHTEILWCDTTSQWAIIRIGSGRSTVFPVKLEKTGGEAGTNEKATSWTYTVTDFLSDEELGKEIDPASSPHQWKRPSIGAFDAAAFGYAHFDNDGTLVLGWINEVARQEACADDGE